MTSALDVARFAHEGQHRRWPDSEPYVLHVARVGAMAEAFDIKFENGFLRMASDVGVLHDILEDTDVTYDNLAESFGPRVAKAVLALTKTPDVGEEAYLAGIKAHSNALVRIKLIDRFDNLAGPFPNNPAGRKFMAKYIPETKRMLEFFKGADPVLESMVAGRLAIIEVSFKFKE